MVFRFRRRGVGDAKGRAVSLAHDDIVVHAEGNRFFAMGRRCHGKVLQGRHVVFSARHRQDDYFAVVLSAVITPTPPCMYARAGAPRRGRRCATPRGAARVVAGARRRARRGGRLIFAVTRCHGKVLEFDLAVPARRRRRRRRRRLYCCCNNIQCQCHRGR